jgi:type I restriction enzyme, S subunit
MELKVGYKQTEVGVIPEDWDLLELHDACQRIVVGLATSVTKHYRPSGVPIVRNLNIKDGYLDGRDMLYVSTEFAKANASKSAKSFDVLTVRTGANLGDTCVLPDAFDNCQTFTTLITTPKRSLLTPRFLCLHMSSFNGKKEMSRLQVGSGKGNLNAGELKRYRIGAPPIPEQESIAEAVSDTNALVESLRLLIAKKRELKQGAMQELITGKTRLPGFDRRWEETNLGSIADRIVGGGTPSRSRDSYWRGDIPWMTVKDFARHNPFGTLEYITSEGLKNSASNLIPKGNLITSTRMALGKVAILAVDVSINQDLKAIFPSKDTNTNFLYYWFQFNEARIAKMGSGSTVMGISLGDFRKIPFRRPAFTEQVAIAAILTDIDAEITALEAKLSKARELKQGMMQELLTGRMRLI